jgi:hypothetical protein
MRALPSWFHSAHNFGVPGLPEEIKKRPTRTALEKEAREGGKVSGKAMQDEVKANAQTLGLEKTTFLEEGYFHPSFAASLGCPFNCNSQAKALDGAVEFAEGPISAAFSSALTVNISGIVPAPERTRAGFFASIVE